MISFDSLKFVWMQFVTNKLKFQDKQKNINWADELESAWFLLWTVCVCVVELTLLYTSCQHKTILF